MNTNKTNGQVTLRDVRVSYPNLFEPRAFSPGDREKFSATFLIEKGSENQKVVEDAIRAVARGKWGDNVPNPLKHPLRDGSEKESAGYTADQVFFSANTTKRPVIVNRTAEPVVDGDPEAPYAGCYVNATVSFWAMDSAYGKRVCCELRGVQFVRDGDAFGGGSPAVGFESLDGDKAPAGGGSDVSDLL